MNGCSKEFQSHSDFVSIVNCNDFFSEKLCEKCPNTKFLLSGIYCRYFPVFGLNTEKYRPGKTPYGDTFDAVKVQKFR